MSPEACGAKGRVEMTALLVAKQKQNGYLMRIASKDYSNLWVEDPNDQTRVW
jgi:hypothetical protein